MRLDVARSFAQNLLAACDKAEQEGRTELNGQDFDSFVLQDNLARAELEAAIGAATIQINN